MSPGSVRKHAVWLRRRRLAVDAEAEALAVAIREALAEGYPVSEIAEAADLSRQRIYQIRDGKR